jgi:hypothetical protein
MVRMPEAASPQATKLREIVGVFHSIEGVESAIAELATEGFDRADMSILGEEHLLSGNASTAVRDTQRLADDPTAPRQPIISDSDIRQGRTLATSLAGVVAAFVATGATILTGGGVAAAVIGAAAAGGGASAVVNAVGRLAGNKHQEFFEDQIRHGGILLWVALREPDDEGMARLILERHGATDVHVHEAPG